MGIHFGIHVGEQNYLWKCKADDLDQLYNLSKQFEAPTFISIALDHFGDFPKPSKIEDMVKTIQEYIDLSPNLDYTYAYRVWDKSKAKYGKLQTRLWDKCIFDESENGLQRSVIYELQVGKRNCILYKFVSTGVGTENVDTSVQEIDLQNEEFYHFPDDDKLQIVRKPIKGTLAPHLNDMLKWLKQFDPQAEAFTGCG